MANMGLDKSKGGFWVKFFNASSNANDAEARENKTQILAPIEDDDAHIENNAVSDSVEEKDVLPVDAQEMSEDAAFIREAAAAARQIAENEYAFKTAEQEVARLEERFFLVQKQAQAALGELSLAEQAYSEAKARSQVVIANELALRKEMAREITRIRENNETALAKAKDDIKNITSELLVKKERAAVALSEYEKAEADFARQQKHYQENRATGEETIRNALAELEQFKRDTETLEKAVKGQCSAFDKELKSAQENIEKLAAARLTAESARLECAQKLKETLKEGKQGKDQLIEELDGVIDFFEEKIAAAEKDKDKAAGELAIYREAFAKADEEAANADAVYKSALAEPQRLLDEQAAFFSGVETEKEKNATRIEAARKNAEKTKETYSEAQRQVVVSIAASTKANDLANTARTAADQAAWEQDGAIRAANTAEKIKGDDAGDAFQVREEKTARYRSAEAEALRLRAEADRAVAKAKDDAVTANLMLEAWLVAEETLEDTIAKMNAANRRLEEEKAAASLKCKKDIAAAKKDGHYCKKQQAILSRQKEQAKANLVLVEKKYAAACQPLLDLEEKYKEERRRIEQALADKEGEIEAKAIYCREEISRLDAQKESLTVELEQKRGALEERRDICAGERERLLCEVEAQRNALADLGNRTACIQRQIEAELDEIREAEEEAMAVLATFRETAEETASEVVRAEAAYARALDEAEAVRAAGDLTLTQAEQAAKAALSQKINERCDADSILSQSYEKLQECRKTAAQTVRESIELSVGRLEAANKIAVQRLEREIADLEQEIACAEEKRQNEQAALEDTKADFAALEMVAAGLRDEEERLEAEAAQKYDEIKRAKDKELACLEETLGSLSDAEEKARIACEAIEKELSDLESEWLKAEILLSTAKSEEESVAAAMPMQIAAAEENYQIALKKEAEKYPELAVLLNDGQERLDAALSAYEAAEHAWKKQAALVSKLGKEEIAAEEDALASLEKLKAENAANLETAKQAIASLEKRKVKLEEAHAKAQDHVNKTTASRKNAEEYLQKILNEEKAEQAEADKKLADIEDQLEQLQAEEDLQAQKFHATEEMLSDSAAILADAENRTQDARGALAKLEAEMATAEAGRKTYFTKIQEQALSYHSADEETDTHGAKDLFREADEAELLFAKKKKAFDKTKTQLETYETELANLRREIADAPARLERDNEAWRKAAKKYRKFEKEADKLKQAIRTKIANFIIKRTGARNEAEAELARCAKENDAAISKADRIFYQVRDIMEEIAQMVEDIPAIENKGLEKITDLELLTAQRIQEKRGMRIAAEEQARDMQSQMEFRRNERDILQQQLEQIGRDFARGNETYRLACEKLGERFEKEKKGLADHLTEANKKAAKLQHAFSEAEDRKKEKESVLAAAKKDYELRTVAKLAAITDRDKLSRLRDATLNDLEEEKLRILGSHTVERIATEEKATWAEQKMIRLETDLADTLKLLNDLNDTRELYIRKLAQIDEEGQRSIAAAKENILVNTTEAV